MNSSSVLASGRNVIAKEAAALKMLAASLDESFVKAVELMRDTKGKVVVSGMGKSGHIGKKIAATLASTGTPAFFVHPAEASHGDLGMLTRDDVALVLSNSGETPELTNIIAYTRRFNIPMIGVAGKANSTLIRRSDIAIILPNAGEACPIGLAPTSSTTMTLAFGDALAVALMESQEISRERYRDFHPGGQLGARLSTVGDLMHTKFPIIKLDARMSEVLLVISQMGFGVAGVCDDEENLVGIITDGDLRRHMDGLLGFMAGKVMTANPQTIGPDALAEEAVALMNDRQITSLFVVDQNKSKTVGILHIHDCLRAGVA